MAGFWKTVWSGTEQSRGENDLAPTAVPDPTPSAEATYEYTVVGVRRGKGAVRHKINKMSAKGWEYVDRKLTSFGSDQLTFRRPRT